MKQVWAHSEAAPCRKQPVQLPRHQTATQKQSFCKTGIYVQKTCNDTVLLSLQFATFSGPTHFRGSLGPAVSRTSHDERGVGKDRKSAMLPGLSKWGPLNGNVAIRVLCSINRLKSALCGAATVLVRTECFVRRSDQSKGSKDFLCQPIDKRS